MPAADFQEHFSGLTDPRRREGVYPLENIVAMSICAVICGADDFVAIAEWAAAKREWLATFLDLSAGVPSHDRFNAILPALDPREFERCLLSWIADLHEISEGQIIAIDGKTLRRSFDAASGKAAIHMVSAWATENRISLGQVVLDSKSNEITAIPKLLELLTLSKALVTIDAMGCQVEIARQITDRDADYCLAVKANQPTLHQGVVDHFERRLENDFAKAKVRKHETHERGRGRIEDRYYYLCPVPPDLPDRERWTGLSAIGMVRQRTERDGKECLETRYYILGERVSAKRFAAAVRGHWGIENHLHWQLDVTFHEDQSRIRMGHADANFSVLRRAALGLLKNEKTAKVGVKNKRLAAGWNDDYLLKVLLGP